MTLDTALNRSIASQMISQQDHLHREKKGDPGGTRQRNFSSNKKEKE